MISGWEHGMCPRLQAHIRKGRANGNSRRPPAIGSAPPLGTLPFFGGGFYMRHTQTLCASPRPR